MDAKDQAQAHLLWWAKFIAEETRARYGYGSDDPDDIQPPSWLAELEGVVDECETEGCESLEP